MSFGLRLQPEAREDIRSAARWYEARRRGLGRRLVAEVDACLAAIRERPRRFPRVHRHFRRALIRRFPYGVVFAVAHDTVEVVACLHHRRDPDIWISRT